MWGYKVLSHLRRSRHYFNRGGRFYHVEGSPTRLDKVDEFFSTKHSHELTKFYGTYPSKPRKTISRVDFIAGWARCPPPYKEDFLDALKLKLIVVEDGPGAFPWPIPPVSPLSRPIVFLPPPKVPDDWVLSFSDFGGKKVYLPGGGFVYEGLGAYFRTKQNSEPQNSRPEYDSQKLTVSIIELGEMTAFRWGLQDAVSAGDKKIHCFTDCKNVADWINGINTHLMPVTMNYELSKILSLFSKCDDFLTSFIHREGNTVADILARGKLPDFRSERIFKANFVIRFPRGP